MLESVQTCKDDAEFVCYTSWLERCADCKKSLGEGYGDADHYPTRYRANKERNRLRPYINQWLLYLPTKEKSK